MECVDHGRDIRQCGDCLPKPFWSKDHKRHRCGRLVHKDLPCVPCEEWARKDERYGYAAHRLLRAASVKLDRLSL